MAGCQTYVVDGVDSARASGAQVSLPSGITIAAPKGYCRDRRSGRRGAVVFASCVRLSGRDGFDPTYGHLLTATAAGAKTDLPRLAGFVRKEAGKSWLAVRGKAEDIAIHTLKRSRNALYVEISIGRGRTILARGVGKPLSMSQISWWCWASTLDWVRAFLASTVKSFSAPLRKRRWCHKTQ